MQLSLSTLVTVALMLAIPTAAFPRMDPEAMKRWERRQSCNAGVQTPRKFVSPKPLPDGNVLTPIPDAAHPYKAPGPGDTRGPCPAMNTLANHGYINRTGVDTIENIIRGSMEGLNMDLAFASFVTGFSALARGNANIDMLSIGHPSVEVPPLPGCIDGSEAGGLAKHGRFEGDVSNSRQDAGLGNQVDFSMEIYDGLLDAIEKYGDDSSNGKLINLKVLQEYKYSSYQMFQAEDKELQFHLGRQLAAYNEAALILLLFSNGKTNQLTTSDLSSFFANQTFPPNFYRRATPATMKDITGLGMQIREAHPIMPGANDENGNWVIDQPVFTNYACDAVHILQTDQLAAGLNNVTGVFLENVNAYLDLVFAPFAQYYGCTNQGRPSGEPGL